MSAKIKIPHFYVQNDTIPPKRGRESYEPRFERFLLCLGVAAGIICGYNTHVSVCGQTFFKCLLGYTGNYPNGQS